MGMAYSKAWKILRETEREFGPLLVRDGVHGSQLTENALTLLSRYQEMLAAATQAAEAVFRKYYP